MVHVLILNVVCDHYIIVIVLWLLCHGHVTSWYLYYCQYNILSMCVDHFVFLT